MRDERSRGSPSTDDALVLEDSVDPSLIGRFAERISRYVRTLYVTGDEAEQRHMSALEELRREPGEAVIALAKAEACCHRHDYPRRWALIYGAARLEEDASLPYLRELVLTPVPLSGARNVHGFSVAREETILRTTAIEGIGRLARRGNKLALEALLEFLEISSISIRRASIQAILSAEPSCREKLAERLPVAFRYLLEVQQLDVTKVPQVKNPRSHLKDKKPRRKPLPPELTPSSSSQKSKKRRSPKLGGK